MSPELKIARGFALPLNAVTEVISVLATRGAGKSFGSADVIEELYAAGLQFVVIDPMGVYWGLRSSYDGTKAGLKIIVLGGDQGDVPLEPTSGRLIADVVVDSGHSFVLDLSLFDSKAEQVRFMEAFLERVFYRKGPIENRTPLMIVVDEADEFAPQKPEKNETKMLSHMIRLAKRGRTRGIGLMSLTQRSADFSKAVLALSSAVFFMRTADPRDRKAIKQWLAGQAEHLISLVDSQFPSLETGHALIYSPHWLKLVDPLEIKFRMIRTFDSYKTPEPGEVRVAPKRKASIDLKALGAEIAATVERAKKNDPEELRRMNAELGKKLRDAEGTIEHLSRTAEAVEARVERVVEEVKVPVFKDGEVETLGKLAGTLAAVAADLSAAAKSISTAVEAAAATVVDRVREAERVEQQTRRPAAAPAPAPPPRPAARPARTDEEIAARNGSLTGPQQRVLDAVAWYAALGNHAPSKQQVGFIAGYRVGKNVGGTYGNILGQLRNQHGLIDYVGGNVVLTQEGAALAQDPGIERTNEAMQEAVMARLSGPEERVLRVLIDAYPNAMTKQEVGAASGYTVGANVGGTFGNILGKLRTLGVIDYPSPGDAVALDVLFPMGA